MKMSYDLLRYLPIDIRMEIEENVMRKEFNQLELASIQRLLLDYFQQHNKQGRPSKDKKVEIFPPLDGKSRDIVGSLFDESGKTVEKRMAVVDAAEENPEKYGDLVETMDEKSVNAAHKEMRARKRVEELEKIPPLPSDKYRVIYADPPWKYNDSGLDDYGHAERHYNTMSIQELVELGPTAKGLSEADAVLWLWVTSPLLEDAFKIIKAWGFKYKTSFVWDKEKHNFGHYNSVRHELLLIATRGSCTPDVRKLFDSVQTIPRSDKHSEKPEEFREIIDTIYPHGKRIELFARKKADGWDIWGDKNVG